MSTKPILTTDRVFTSTDGGTTWVPERVCSEQIQVDALVRGFREFAAQRSRKHDYPQGIMVRWHGVVQ